MRVLNAGDRLRGWLDEGCAQNELIKQTHVIEKAIIDQEVSGCLDSFRGVCNPVTPAAYGAVDNSSGEPLHMANAFEDGSGSSVLDGSLSFFISLRRPKVSS